MGHAKKTSMLKQLKSVKLVQKLKALIIDNTLQNHQQTDQATAKRWAGKFYSS